MPIGPGGTCEWYELGIKVIKIKIIVTINSGSDMEQKEPTHPQGVPVTQVSLDSPMWAGAPGKPEM